MGPCLAPGSSFCSFPGGSEEWQPGEHRGTQPKKSGQGRWGSLGGPGEGSAGGAAGQSWAEACSHLKGTEQGREASGQWGRGFQLIH